MDNHRSDESYLSEVALESAHHQPSTRTQNERHNEDDDASFASMVSSIAAITRASIRETIAQTVSHWKVVAFGQLLSLTLAAGGAAQATLHFQCGLSAPAFSSALFYCLLIPFLIPLYLKGRRMRDPIYGITDAVMGDASSVAGHQWTAPHWFCGVVPLELSPWKYCFLAFLDVQGNYLTVLAYRYTALTSVALFDALAIPSAMVLSRIFLRRQHTAVHLVGVLMCMSGVIYNAMADYESDLEAKDVDRHDGSKRYPHKITGDLMAILGGLVFGANDVLAEAFVRRTGGAAEFLGMLGLFAALISFAQALLLERSDVADFFRSETASSLDDEQCSVLSSMWILGGFMLANAVNYFGTARFLLVSEATFLNLSLLTADLWSVAFSVLAERIVPHPLFWVALTMIVSGVLTYEMAPSPVVDSDGGQRKSTTSSEDDGLMVLRQQPSQQDVALTL